ncbi:unnamed protein product [Blepharisma stoltei]|uniref:ATP synthase F0 subunit 8 n=1 Tax=Blepharisma stoltei TaxID=1481888 RepID=A0AAU9ICC9_9CILI|nr:unnamed protein product [Blepharisma stoltei]
MNGGNIIIWKNKDFLSWLRRSSQVRLMNLKPPLKIYKLSIKLFKKPQKALYKQSATCSAISKVKEKSQWMTQTSSMITLMKSQKGTTPLSQSWPA